MTSDMKVTINSLAESMDLHANKLTAAVIHCHLLFPIIWVAMDRASPFVKIQNILKLQNWGSQQSPNNS